MFLRSLLSEGEFSSVPAAAQPGCIELEPRSECMSRHLSQQVGDSGPAVELAEPVTQQWLVRSSTVKDLRSSSLLASSSVFSCLVLHSPGC